MKKCSPLAAGLVVLFVSLGAYAADACKHRGELDAMYCDENNDMVADPPTDAKKWKNPSTIVFTYTPVEDPAVYENIFKPFTTHLAKCLDKKVVFYQVQSNAAEIEAGTPAGRRFFDRTDGLRRQSGGCGAVRGQGNREGVSGLQPDRHRQGNLTVSENVRPQGQESCAHLAVVEFRPYGADGTLPRRRADAR